MDLSLPLGEYVTELVESWIDDYPEEAHKGNIEGTLLYSKLLLRGSEDILQDERQGIHWLKEN